MSQNDDRPNAGGEGAGDQGQEDWNPLGLDVTSSAAAVNRPPLSPLLRDLAERNGLQSLCPFLARLPVKDRERVLNFFRDLRADRWQILRAGRKIGQEAVRNGKRVGGDTLPSALRIKGYSIPNDRTRALLVAALVCGWPDEFRGRVTLRDRAAKDFIASGWRPDLPTRRRGRKG